MAAIVNLPSGDTPARLTVAHHHTDTTKRLGGSKSKPSKKSRAQKPTASATNRNRRHRQGSSSLVRPARRLTDDEEDLVGVHPLRTYQRCRRRLYNALDGYYITHDEIDDQVSLFTSLLVDQPQLIVAELQDCFSAFETQMPRPLSSKFSKAMDRLQEAVLEVQGATTGSDSDIGDDDDEECIEEDNEEQRDEEFVRSSTARLFSVREGNGTITTAQASLHAAVSGRSSSGRPQTQVNTAMSTAARRSSRTRKRGVRGKARLESFGEGTRGVSITVVGANQSYGSSLLTAPGTGPTLSMGSFDSFLGELIQDLHFTFSRECCSDALDSTPGGSSDPNVDQLERQARQQLRITLAPLEALLLKYCQGYIQAGVNELRQLLLYYLEVEEIFHSSDSDSTSLVIHSKRPNFEPAQLLSLARSHQALKAKNRLVLDVLETVKKTPELLEFADHYEPCLRRLASLSKIDYSSVSHAARQLLMTRRDRSFLQKTLELTEALWDILDAHTAPAAPSGPTSPVTFGGRLWSTYFTSPTPGSGGVTCQSGGSLTTVTQAHLMQQMLGYAAGPASAAPPPSCGFLFPQYMSGVNLSGYALDLSKFPTDSLLAILGHQNSKLRKLAINILVMRTFGVRRGKVHDFRVRAQGESWQFPDTHNSSGTLLERSPPSNATHDSTDTDIASQRADGGRRVGSCKHYATNKLLGLQKATDGSCPSGRGAHFELPSGTAGSSECAHRSGIQEANQLIAIWTHDALLGYEYLISHLDPLRRVLDNPGAAGGDSGRPSNVAPLFHEGSLTSRMDPSGSSGASALASRYVAAGSRLHHMLNAFAGAADDPHSSVGKSQQTTAFLIESFRSSAFDDEFRTKLAEIAALQPFLPSAPPAADGRILLVVILALKPGIEGLLTPGATTFQHVVMTNTNLLSSLGFNLIWFACLGLDGGEQPTRSDVKGFDYLPVDVSGVKCYYFRNTAALPICSELETHAVAGVSEEGKAPGQGKGAIDIPERWVEEPLLRNCEIPLFPYLELRRLRNFWVTKRPTSAPYVHLFEAVPKNCSGPVPGQKISANMSRFFVRICTNLNDPPTSELGMFEQERAFVSGLNALELSLREATSTSTKPIANHHILMTVVYIAPSKNKYPSLQNPSTFGNSVHTTRASPAAGAPSQLASGQPGTVMEVMKFTPTAADQIARGLYERYSKRIQKLGATVIEMRFKTRGLMGTLSHTTPGLNDGVYPYRIILDNPTGQTLRSRRFVEIQNPSTGERVFAALDSRDSLSTLVLKSNACSTSFSKLAQTTLPSPTDVTGERKVGTATGSTASPSDTNDALLKEDTDYDGRSVDTPHPGVGALEAKRAQAAALQTLYIYDFLELLEVAVKNMWRKCPKYLFGGFDERDSAHGGSRDPDGDPTDHRSDSLDSLMSSATTLVPDKVVEAVEFTLNRTGDFVEVARPPGQNECGMVAWRVLLRTPEFPKGRRIILIGNDVTHQMGTFGVLEDLLFQRASEVARAEGVPRVYIAVNSGARMGLALEIQAAFKVEWIDPEHPSKGFRYLYLGEADYRRFKRSDSIVAEPVNHPIEGRVWKIVDIIGSGLGLGVECLCGSGAIAGETSRAYKDTMTLTYVTGRTVGIGAYLTRLGHRVIQKNQGAPILLTGYLALNRLIGREVYTSNEEIGGIDVMSCNGVSHLVVQSDLEACQQILEWLSYVPEHKEGPLPMMIDRNDPWSRRVEYRPSSNTEDPRYMLTGCTDANGRWLGGILDRSSFIEIMPNWAKSVITGHGRLGGIPVGVILVETRVTEVLVPADPAMPLSSELKLSRAGQVWYPESAYKTAQAINDFNQEEIPLMIFANWRGFSGGRRDMFFEVLKFGSMIVDALVDFKQPCFVYIPPKAELRGGAWVVVDPRINPDYMEMFADPESRGGVLEPSGMVEIKFREKALREAATRSDPELARLTREESSLAAEGVPIDDLRRQSLIEKKDARWAILMPVIKQVAMHFAELHDTPVRMKRKSAVHDIVSWEKSRSFFYWRLRRQLILFNVRNEVIKCYPKMTLIQAQKLILRWASESGPGVENSQEFVIWACHSIQDFSRRLHTLRTQYVTETVGEFCKESVTAVADGLNMLDSASHERLLCLLKKGDDGDVEGCNGGGSIHLLGAYQNNLITSGGSLTSGSSIQTGEHRRASLTNKSTTERQQAALDKITLHSSAGVA